MEVSINAEITTKSTSKLSEEVSNMFKKLKSFFKSAISVFCGSKISERSHNDWRVSVFELSDEEIFEYVNEALSNFSFLKSLYSFANISENVYLKSYLENTHEALEVLRVVMLSRAKNLRVLSSWNTRVVETIDEIEITLCSCKPSINRCTTDISNASIAWLKMITGNPKQECR